MREHFTLPGTIICANFSFTFVDFTLANVLDDRSTILRCIVPNFQVVSVFHALCHCLKYILLLLQFEIFSTFTSQGIASRRFLPIIYWSDEFLNRVSKSLDIQASPRASTFVKNILATSCRMHTTEFAQHLLNHLCAIAIFAFTQCEQHSCCLFQATAPTQLHLHFVILTPLH